MSGTQSAFITGANAALAPPDSAAGAKRRTDFENIGKDDFLKLLVVQLQHQDPLNPLKNEEFIAQLATFSSLEQLIDIRESVQKLVDATSVAEGTADTATE